MKKYMVKEYIIVCWLGLVLLAAFFVSSASAVTVLTWEDLVPEEGKGSPIFIARNQEIFGLPDRESFDGDNEDYAYLLESLGILRSQQPSGGSIRQELDGKKVKIPGYITPLDFTEGKLGAFLLVPYHGACIHVPPPPGNQIIFVKKAKNVAEEQLYLPVWITGTIRAKPIGTAVADVGYSIENAVVEPYDEP